MKTPIQGGSSLSTCKRGLVAVFEMDFQRIPTLPGVYIFEDASGEALYVGKAVSLRPRVRSYFGSPKGKPGKIRAMMEKAASVRFIVTDTEMEAIALELNLIKRYMPRYNIMLRDDKHYPYIKVTVADRWPRAFLTRKVKKDGSRYFGPYYPSGSVNEILRTCRWLFPFRACSDRTLKSARRPCLDYHIGRCLGPCHDHVTEEDYRSMVRHLCLMLEGRYDKVLETLERKMEQKSEALDFEAAAEIRNQMEALKRLGVEQKVISPSKSDRDVAAVAREDGLAVVMVMFIREGRLLGQKPYVLWDTEGTSTEELLGVFTRQHYLEADVPPEVLLTERPEGSKALEEWLSSLRGKKVRLVVPKKGEKKRLVEMAARNAHVVLEEAKMKGAPSREGEHLAEVLGLSEPPHRVECFDISNLQGKQPVGSMVVSVEGECRKDLYRKFKIGLEEAPDDYRMMKEVLTRRLKRGIEEGGGWEIPDLLVVDGGKGHLQVAVDVLRDQGLQVPVAALAEGEERVFLPGAKAPLDLPRGSPGLNLLMRMRDEAHRFALGYHRRIRRGEATRSLLDGIPGVGPVKKKALLRAFGSVKALSKAGTEQIAEVKGIGWNLAQVIKEHLEH